MKSLKEYILEAKEGSKEIQDIANALADRNVDDIRASIIKFVDDNEKIEAKDCDDIENGCLIGYSTSRSDKVWKTCAIAFREAKSQYTKWNVAFISEGGQIEFSKEVELYTNIFGNVWRITYVEHVPDAIEKEFE